VIDLVCRQSRRGQSKQQEDGQPTPEQPS
jgi:hypothetical protein